MVNNNHLLVNFFNLQLLSEVARSPTLLSSDIFDAILRMSDDDG